MRARFRARRRSRRPSHERCHHCYERSNEAIQSRCNRSRLPDCLASLAREIDDTRPLLGVATCERTLAAAACAESFEPVHRLKFSTLSCPRFLWTPYCPEKLEDDSVEGNGKTMIDEAGLVGSEG